MSEFYRKEDVVQELAEYLMYDAQMEYATASEDIEDWIDLAEHILKGIPTLDLVRCLECKHWKRKEQKCPHLNLISPAGFYCKDGTRKGESDE